MRLHILKISQALTCSIHSFYLNNALAQMSNPAIVRITKRFKMNRYSSNAILTRYQYTYCQDGGGGKGVRFNHVGLR